MRGQSAGRQKLLLFIYARMVVASAVSVAYESLVVAAGSAPLRIYEKPGVAGFLRGFVPVVDHRQRSDITDTQ